jgi:phage terminase large subunit
VTQPKLRFEIPEKALPIFEDPKRYNILYGGRGSSKSWTIAEILSVNGYREPRRILCGREIQNSLDESVFQLLLDTQERMGISEFYTPVKGAIVGKNGTQFLFKGLQTMSINKIKSLEGIDDCWLEEAHVLSNKSLRTLVPTIRKKGSRFYVSMNPELDDDPAYERFIAHPSKDAHIIKMDYLDNPWFEDSELEQERADDYERDKTPDKNMYKHVWLGHTLPAVEGAIFAGEVAEFMEQHRHREVDHDPMGLVHGIMDLGYGVMTMVLAQRFGTTVSVIGYHEWRNSTYAKITKQLEEEHPEYRWGKIFMPHDAAHRDPKTGHSHFRVMNDLGWDTESVPQIGIENYIEKGRKMFGNCYINTGNGGDDLMRCLKRFKYKVSENNPDKRMSPDKDDFSHGAEAYCYTAVVADKLVNETVVINDPYKGFRSGYAA